MLLFQAEVRPGEHGSGGGQMAQLPSAVGLFLSVLGFLLLGLAFTNSFLRGSGDLPWPAFSQIVNHLVCCRALKFLLVP